MTESKPDMLEELNVPKRKPWILVVLLLGVVALGVWLARRRDGADASGDDVRPAGESVSNAVPAQVPVAIVASPVSVAPVAAASNQVQAAVTPAGSVAATNALAVLLAEAKDLEAKDSLVEATEKLRQALSQAQDPKLAAEMEGRIGELNSRLIVTPRPMPNRVFHVVQSGESVDKIAKQYGTTIDLITTSNQLKAPDLIKAGDRLAVYTGRFSVVVSKGRNDLLLLDNEVFFKRYLVGTGKHGRTPPGTYEVIDKQKQPVWWRPDGKEIPFGSPENILGTRWLSLKAKGSTPDVKGYGIHGSWDESTLGKAESAGCVRMRNRDVEELYALVPYHTLVTIVE